ncbi:MAG: LuxR C-terminal-related transcriptional regulator [Sulfuricurvum sp.]|nr:LuxR C-terminal-related transcriptional regulator [Sulfuricurvum sp.]
MNLYCVSDEDELLQYWKAALHTCKPLSFRTLSELPLENEAVVFISDTLLLNFPYEVIGLHANIRMMILSRVPDFEQAQRFLAHGAMGYGNAMMHEHHLHSAYKTLEDGNVWLYPDFITQLIAQVRDHNIHKEISLHRLDVLTPREREVALLLNKGKSHLEVSEEMGITVRTVKAHSASIYEKLFVKDRLALSLLLHS